MGLSPQTMWGKGYLAAWITGFVDLQISTGEGTDALNSLPGRKKPEEKTVVLLVIARNPLCKFGLNQQSSKRTVGDFYQLGSH